jgi:hypothetical protein
MTMKNLNATEITCVAGGMLAGSTLLSRPVHTSLPAVVVVLPTITYEPSPTFDPGLPSQSGDD